MAFRVFHLQNYTFPTKNSAFFPAKTKIQEFSPYSKRNFRYIFAPMKCVLADGS